MLSQRAKFDFESQQRSAVLNLTSAYAFQAITLAPDLNQAIGVFDAFVEAHSKKQPD